MSERMINARTKCRIDTPSNWTQHNPLLLKGELGVEEITGFFKFGNGTHRWNDLVYAQTPGGGGNISIDEPSIASLNDEATAARTLWNILGGNRQELVTASKQLIPAINETFDRLGDFDWVGEEFYTEGTFDLQIRALPSHTAPGMGTNVPINIHDATFTRTGNRVQLNAFFTFPSPGARPGGLMQVRGLPFPPMVRGAALPIGSASFSHNPQASWNMFGYWTLPFFTFREIWQNDFWVETLPSGQAVSVQFTCNYQIAR